MATPGSMLIDEFMPRWDVSIAAHAIVRRDPAVAFRAAADLAFMAVHTPLLNLAMRAPGLPARMTGRASEPARRLVLAKSDPAPGWRMRAEAPDRALAFGAVGKCWPPSMEWRDVPVETFAP